MMATKLNLPLTTSVVLTALLLLTACNTMEGAGKDVQAGGKKLEKAAERNN